MMMYRFFQRNLQRKSKNFLEKCKLNFFVSIQFFFPVSLSLVCIPDIQLVYEHTISMGYFKPDKSLCYMLNTETYLYLSQTSVMEFLCKFSEQPLAVCYFCKKAHSQMFDNVLNMPLEEANY